MGKKSDRGRLTPSTPNHRDKGSIPDPSTHSKLTDWNQKKVLFSFESCSERRHRFQDLDRRSVKQLAGCLQRMSCLTWVQIMQQKGLNYKSVPDGSLLSPIAGTLPEDCRMDYFRVDRKFRVFGYRTRNIFYFIWFDRDHQEMTG